MHGLQNIKRVLVSTGKSIVFKGEEQGTSLA
jgi:hypothetical protein